MLEKRHLRIIGLIMLSCEKLKALKKKYRFGKYYRNVKNVLQTFEIIREDYKDVALISLCSVKH